MTESLVIKKYSKREDLTPADFRQDPIGSAHDLLRCFVRLDNRLSPIEERGQYSSQSAGWATGKHVYFTQAVFDAETATQFPGIILRRDESLFPDDEIMAANLPALCHLPMSQRLGDYSRIIIPEEKIPALLPIMVISHGLTAGSEPLELLHLGSGVVDLLTRQGLTF